MWWTCSGQAPAPLTAKDVATRLFKISDPQRNDIAKAKRRLTAAVSEGRAQRVEPAPGEAAKWTLGGGCTRGVHTGCTQGVHGEGARQPPRKGGPGTPVHVDAEEGYTSANEAESDSLTASNSANLYDGDSGVGDQAWLDDLEAMAATFEAEVAEREVAT